MRKRRLGILAATGALLLLAAMIVSSFGGGSSIERHLEERLGIQLPRDTQIWSEDDHGGFHGDGLLKVKITMPEDKGEQLFSVIRQNWKPLPVKDAGLWHDAAALWAELSAPKQGYWFYRDRYQEQYGKRCSFNPWMQNCTFAVLDEESGILYVMESDF